jgi:hypothetical protein
MLERSGQRGVPSGGMPQSGEASIVGSRLVGARIGQHQHIRSDRCGQVGDQAAVSSGVTTGAVFGAIGGVLGGMKQGGLFSGQLIEMQSDDR